MGFSCSTSQRTNHPKLINPLSSSKPNEWFQDSLDVQLPTTQTTLVKIRSGPAAGQQTVQKCWAKTILLNQTVMF